MDENSVMTEETARAIERLAHELGAAERVLVGAGAGFSAAAGLSYFDHEAFAKHYPAMAQRGFLFAYQLVGRRDDEWSLGRKWAYLATHIHYVRDIFPSAPLYHDLLRLLEGRDFFVVTSNCDRQFMRAGFPLERLFEYQGSYDNFGCSAHCGAPPWSNREFIPQIVEHIDPDTFECPEEFLPRCPRCGALADWTSRPATWNEEGHRYMRFIEECNGKRLCILELGVGFNTPVVIRWPFERICHAYKDSTLFRVNHAYREAGDYGGYPEVPAELGERGVPIDCDAAVVIERLGELLGKR